MEKIRIGVVGLNFGVQHVRTLANMENADLVAVADSRLYASGGMDGFEAKYGVRSYRDGVEMLEVERLDAVSVCTSPARRADLIQAAVSRGIALFIEKPWATDLEHAKMLAALCAGTKAPVMVAFSFRFHPVIVRLRELIDSELGPTLMLNGEYVFDWRPDPRSWLWDPHNGNGFINENSCHLFDSVCYLMGEPQSVMAEATNPFGMPAEHAAAITIRFRNGGIAVVTVGGIAAGGFQDFPRIDLVATAGQARLSGRQHIWEKLEWTLRGENLTHSLVRSAEALGNTRYTDAFNHFFECILSGKSPTASVDQGVMSVALAMAVVESARSGKKIMLDW